MDSNITNIFYTNNILNKNKLRETWLRENEKELFKSVTEFISRNEIDTELKFSNKIFLYINNIDKIPTCEICGLNNRRFIGFKEGYDPFCSRKCASKKSIRSSIEKRRINTLEKWGVEHTSQLNSVKEKQKRTNIEKWGFISPSLNPTVEEKRKKTMLEKWGVEYSAQNKNLLSKSMTTRFSKYKEYMMNTYSSLNIKDIPKEGTLIINCPTCNNHYEIKNELLRLRYFRYGVETCLHCNPISSYKYTGQNEIYNFISDIIGSDKIIRGDRKILSGKEVDIYIPEFNLAIEYNGLYWHSDIYKDRNYHLMKKTICEDNGITLIHIWEDDWIHKKDIIKSRILNKLKYSNKIHARKCQIKEVSNNESRLFNIKNNLQGDIKSSFRIGLYFNDELVSLMTFGRFKRGKSGEGEWELYRFSNKLNTNVVGSFTKLIKYFEIVKNPNKIISYLNRDWTDRNNVYEKNGFQFNGYTPINCWYFGDDLIRRQRQKNNIELNSIWDCGKIKYSKIYDL